MLNSKINELISDINDIVQRKIVTTEIHYEDDGGMCIFITVGLIFKKIMYIELDRYGLIIDYDDSCNILSVEEFEQILIIITEHYKELDEIL